MVNKNRLQELLNDIMDVLRSEGWQIDEAVKGGSRRPPNMSRHERALAKALGELNQVHLARLLEQLGDPPSLANLDADFFDQAGQELIEAITRFLLPVYLESAADAMDWFGVGVDWGLVNRSALNWVGDYTFSLVKGITETTRALVSTALERFYQGDFNRGMLEEFLAPAFGPVRASMIAVTEVTRASSMGENEIAMQIMQNNPNIVMVPIWQTNFDDLVCPICGALHEKEAELEGDRWVWMDDQGNRHYTDEEPPAHVNCRCWQNHEMRLR